MASFNLRQYHEIYNAIKAYIIAHQSIVSDFTEGSVISSEIEAFSRELALLYSEARSGFSGVLTKLPYSIFGITRHPAQYATGSVRFTRLLSSGVLMIPQGTQVATPGGVIFETTEAVEIEDGDTTVDSAVRAVEIGSSGNVPAGTVTVLISGIVGVDSVLNTAAIGGGVNAETDAEYLARFRAYLLGLSRSNRNGIITGALLNENLRSASIVENFPPRAGLYNLDLYLDDGNGTVSDLIIEAVKAVIDGDGSLANPGYRAAGINVAYSAPTVVPINVTGTVYVTYSVSEAKTIIDAAITSYINAHIIGQDLVRAQLQKTILAYPWVLDLNIATPSGNVAVNDGQIARASTLNLTYTQVDA